MCLPGGRVSDPRAFSLVELVIVVVIIGVVAAIAIPRFGLAGQNAAEAALRADLHALRKAIDLYAMEHKGDWPGLRDDGAGGGPQTPKAFAWQLTLFSASNGRVAKKKDGTYYLGPYLVRIPPLPVGSHAGQNGVFSMNAFSAPGLSGPSYGWEYEHYAGRIRANLAATELASDGTPYYQW